MNYNLRDKLLQAFVERCKFKHAMAFVQYRKLIPVSYELEAKRLYMKTSAPGHSEELDSMFDARRKDFINLSKKCHELVSEGFLERE